MPTPIIYPAEWTAQLDAMSPNPRADWMPQDAFYMTWGSPLLAGYTGTYAGLYGGMSAAQAANAFTAAPAQFPLTAVQEYAQAYGLDDAPAPAQTGITPGGVGGVLERWLDPLGVFGGDAEETAKRARNVLVGIVALFLLLLGIYIVFREPINTAVTRTAQAAA